MEPRHKELINGNIVDLSKLTKNLSALLWCLETAEVLNLYEIAMINKAKTNAEQCFKFYQIMLRKDGSAYKTLVKALVRTDNERLAKFLWEDEDDQSILHVDTLSSETTVPKLNNQTETLRFLGAPARPQPASSIVLSVLVILAAAAIPFSIVVYMIKGLIDKVLGR